MPRRWQSRALASAACFALGLVWAGPACAVQPWLSVQGTGSCASSAEWLGSRVLAAMVGTPLPGLRVEVQFAEGAVAAVRLLDGSRQVGKKKLAARRCEELRDAVVAVVALALSSEPAQGHPPPAEAAQSAPAAQFARPIETGPAASEPPLRGIGETRPPAASPALLRDWRLSLGAGADDGTLAEQTAVVRAAAAARLAQGQLRALAWYGVPSVREVVLDSFERVRADFAALGFDYCHGLDAGRWLSTCAGLELVLRRYSEITQPVDRERTQRERFELGTSALLGLALAYRSGLVQPEFDLSTQLPLLGAAAGAPPLGVRASFSAAVQF